MIIMLQSFALLNEHKNGRHSSAGYYGVLKGAGAIPFIVVFGGTEGGPDAPFL